MYNDALKYFNDFINSNYDLNNQKVAYKLNHTYRVVNISEKISKNLNLSDEDIELAKVIALLHDIGRFDQAILHNSFLEKDKNYDHAIEGVKFLFDKGEIRNFIKTDKYDNIIKLAILNHNKYSLDENNKTEREILHSKIIRDADKLDILDNRSQMNVEAILNITDTDIMNSLISDKIYNDLLSKKSVMYKDQQTPIDIWISCLGYIFDLNFTISFKILVSNNSLNKIFNRYVYQDKRMPELANFTINYILKKAQ